MSVSTFDIQVNIRTGFFTPGLSLPLIKQYLYNFSGLSFSTRNTSLALTDHKFSLRFYCLK